jgi:transcriptional regulator with XRE-family HTH domain
MDEDEFYDLAGHLLRVEMVKARLNQGQLAERAGISLPTVNRHVNGKPISFSALFRYSRALGIPLQRLIPDIEDADCEWPPRDSNSQPTDVWFDLAGAR